MNAEEIKLLQAQNEALKKQCNSLQQEVKQWKHEYEILDACIELEQGKMSELKAENERLKEKFEIESLTDKTTGETIYRSNVVNKLKELLELRIEDLCESCGASSMMPMPCTVYKQTLQQIKSIVSNIIDGYIRPYGDYEQLKKILDLITKAEEE